jgi:hypothetical protein
MVHPILRGKGLTHSLYPTPSLVFVPPLIANGRSKKRKLLGNAWLDGGMMQTYLSLLPTPFIIAYAMIDAIASCGSGFKGPVLMISRSTFIEMRLKE